MLDNGNFKDTGRPYTAAVVVAAGKSTRMSGEAPKLFIELQGRPVLFYTLNSLNKCPYIDEIVIVARKEFISQVLEIVENADINKFSRAGEGGETRMKSVICGLISSKTCSPKPS